MKSLEQSPLSILLLVDARSRILVEKCDNGSCLPVASEKTVFFKGPALEVAQQLCPKIESVHLLCLGEVKKCSVSIYCASIDHELSEGSFETIEKLEQFGLKSNLFDQEILRGLLKSIEPYLVDIPYIDLSENEYIYRFRTARERNRSVYITPDSKALYQSDLCSVIKEARRQKEKKSGEPALLDFGAVRYIIPSHFGFCLGVQNAIERAYETVATNPNRRVFMLSELIHNPFVNQDLLKRGLRYLQTDKGLALRDDGSLAADFEDPGALWNQLTSEDVVIIPAFGATNEDKIRLIKKGIPIRENDATCMLVEKVWKAARRYANEGFTVLIHGKSEHEETKATFSNSSNYGPALMIRNEEHARVLGEIICKEGSEKRELFENAFAGLYSQGFDPERDLEHIAVVNQTTLLRNETLSIIDYLRGIISEKYGESEVENHLWSKGKGDTLCYATQVNQDALHRAVEEEVDSALVVGGKNSSNTFQLYRVCESKYGDKAHYIQSESNILSLNTIQHYVFPYNLAKSVKQSEIVRPFIQKTDKPVTILLTGGASCPDGIIQQVIHRINNFFPADSIRSVDQILSTFDVTI